MTSDGQALDEIYEYLKTVKINGTPSLEYDKLKYTYKRLKVNGITIASLRNDGKFWGATKHWKTLKIV
jgi:hypothetical protein